jgi:hypothetical protein
MLSFARRLLGVPARKAIASSNSREEPLQQQQLHRPPPPPPPPPRQPPHPPISPRSSLPWTFLMDLALQSGGAGLFGPVAPVAGGAPAAAAAAAAAMPVAVPAPSTLSFFSHFCISPRDPPTPLPVPLAALLQATWGPAAVEQLCVSCSHCASASASATTFLAAPLPPLLVLTLKRFESEAGAMCKRTVPVSIPLTLSLAPFMPSSSSSTGTSAALPYTLMSLIVHCGTLQEGHYLAYFQQRGRWWRGDDSDVTEVVDAQAMLDSVEVSQGVYMVFYSQ